MDLQVMKRSDLTYFVEELIAKYPVEGVKREDQSFVYDSIKSADELCLDFDCTVGPPKKYFLPPEETLLRFTTAPSLEVTPVLESNPFILFGVHPYDLKAINQMDRVFANGVPDPHYLKRREAVLLIGVDPTRVSPRAFWSDMEAATISNGFDLMFTDIGENFVVEIGTEKGKDLLDRHGKARPAAKEEARGRVNIRSQISNMCKKRGLTFHKREIPHLLKHSEETMFWEEKAGKCLSCGTCNLVCPTCYCFDVQDDMELNLSNGARLRRWDGCLLQDFARVATGENFRESRASRYRHRFFRKGLYLFKVLDDIACVGCGRCASSCLADFADPVEAFNRLKEDEK